MLNDDKSTSAGCGTRVHDCRVAMSKFAEFLDGLHPSDRAHWQSLTPAKRKDAEARFALFEDFHAGRIAAPNAIERFGKSSSRFYRLSAQWREKPSLEALGVGIRAPKTRTKLDPNVVNALQAHVASVVRLHADASVRRQVELLLEAAGFGSSKPIGTTALRNIVETERRRVDASGRFGQRIAFDCCALNLPQTNRRPYIMYVVIDAGTGIFIGCSVSENVDIVPGYAAAAADALDWLAQNEDRLPWTARLLQTILVSGGEDEESAKLVEWMTKEKVGGNVLRATGPRRFGSQVRKIHRDRIGRLQITPSRTLEGEALPDNGNISPWTREDVEAELRRTLSEQNDTIIAGLTAANASPPPQSLHHLLSRLVTLK